MALADAPATPAVKPARDVLARRDERARIEKLRAIMIAALKGRSVGVGDSFAIVAHLDASILRTSVAVRQTGPSRSGARVPYLTHASGLGRKSGDPLVDLCCRLMEAEGAAGLRISWTAGQLGCASLLIPANSPDIAALKADARAR